MLKSALGTEADNPLDFNVHIQLVPVKYRDETPVPIRAALSGKRERNMARSDLRNIACLKKRGGIKA